MSSYFYIENDLVKYLEPQGKDKVDLFLRYCGMEICSPSHSFGPILRDHYVIHYILDGKGVYKVGDKTYYLKKNQGFLIEPNVLTYYEADKDNPWNYVWVAFNGLKAEDYLNYANLDSNNLTFEYDKDDLLEKYILDMLKLNNSSNHNELRLQGLLYLFLSVLAEANKNQTSFNESSSYKLYIEKAIEFINNNYTYDIKITDIASYVGLNRSYLSTLFKKNLNLSPQEFLLKFRINKACDLLKSSELSVGDISRSVGYMDPLTFSKTFKKVTGLSPKNYRGDILNIKRCRT